MVRKKKVQTVGVTSKASTPTGYVTTFLQRMRSRSVIIGLLVCIGLCIIFLFILFLFRTGIKSNQAEINTVKTEQEIIERVGKLIFLPTESPQIATVSDVSKLKGQAFFKNAINGDKVLIYTQSGRAILYRPSQHILVEVASLNSTPESKAATAQIDPTPVQNNKIPLRITILNGTTQSGVAGQVQNDIQELYPDSIITTDDATNNYTQTTIYNNKGQHTDIVKQLATRFGWSIGLDMPQGEDNADSDILIVIGAQR